MSSLSGRERLLLAVFFLSGVAALVYQVVWARQLAQVFGSSTESIATVVASFMGGFALGGLVFGELARRLRRPGNTYAIMEVLIAAAGVGLTLLVPHLSEAFASLAASVGNERADLLAPRVGAVFLLVLVPAALMGGTLPVLTRQLTAAGEAAGRPIALLYAANTLGAVVGCLLPDFFLVPAVGMTGTALVAAGLNVFAAVIVLGLRLEISPHEGEAPTMKAAGDPRARSRARLALAGIAMSGMVALGYEVLWARLNVFFAGGQVFGFSVLLAVYLTGLALGSRAVAGIVDRSRNRVALLGHLELWVGVTTVASLPVLFHMDAVRQSIEGAVVSLAGAPVSTQAKFATEMVVDLVGAAAYVLLPTFLLGATVPVAARIVADGGDDPSRAIGRVYFWNTLAGIPGALGAGLLLLPFLGAQRTWGWLAIANALMGLALLAAAHGRSRKLLLPLLILVVMAAVVVSVPRDLVMRNTLESVLERNRVGDDYELVEMREGLNQTAALFEKSFAGEVVEELLLTDGYRMTGRNFYASRYMKLMAHLPAMLAEEPRTACLICFGLGTTLEELVAHDSFERIDVVDISPEVFELYRRIHPDGGALADPRVRLCVDDGRNFLLTCGESYDVITLEPPPPLIAGVVNLYSREFYELARGRLTEGGVLCQWMPLDTTKAEDTPPFLGAAQVAFPESSLWHGIRLETMLIGALQPLRLDPEQLEKRMAVPAVAASLAAIGIHELTDLLATFLMGTAELAEYCANADPITDDRPLLPHSMRRWDDGGVEAAIFADAADPMAHVVVPDDWSRRSEIRFKGEIKTKREIAREVYRRMLLPETDAGTFVAVADDAFAPLLGLAPDDPRLHSYLGIMPRMTRAVKAAAEAGQELDGAELSYLGRVALYVERDPAAARERFSQALESGLADRVGTLYLLGRSEAALGNRAGAKSAWEAVLGAGENAELQRVVRARLAELGGG